MELSVKEKDLIVRFEKYIVENQISKECLVQFIELCGKYTNIKTLSDYAREENLSYNGVKKCRNVVEIFNVKFVVDDE